MSKITRLQAENFKKLRVIDVHPGSGVVDVRGRNAQGKSSALDAIQAALGGKRVMPSRPVRAGEEEGAVRLELDNGTVILRRFTSEGGDTLEVTTPEGAKYGSPQRLLDSLYTSVAFDPLAFTRMEPKDQLARLRSLVTLDVDVDALERQNKADYDARRDKNRELEREQGRLRDMPTFPDAGTKKHDELGLEEAIAGAAEANSIIEQKKVARAQAIDRVAAINTEVDALNDRVTRLLAERNSLQQRLDEAEPLPDPVNLAQAQADLRAAREANRQIDAQAAFVAQGKLVETLERESKALTEAMERRKDDIADAIGRADMPVPGLGFGDGEVLFNDLPLSQASSAEQLRVSTAIGMAQAPELSLMLIRDGSLLDDDGQRILAELAEEQGFQLFVEAVDTSGKVGIVFEDGAVVSIDGEAAPEPEAIGTPKRRPKKINETPASDGEGEAPPVTAGGQEEGALSLASPSSETQTVLAKVDEAGEVTDFRVLDETDDAAIAEAAEEMGGTAEQVEDLRPAPKPEPAVTSLFD